MLRVFLDFKSAGSLLALVPVLDLAARAKLTVQWHPFSTAERDLPDSGADAEVIKSHHAVRERSRRAMDQKYARLRGIELRYPPSSTSADLALGALAQMTVDPLPFIRASFDAYWNKHLDLDNESVVASLIAQSGVEPAGDLGAARRAFEAPQSAAQEAGVVDAPAFLIGGQLFIGRQHLPWIEEIALTL